MKKKITKIFKRILMLITVLIVLVFASNIWVGNVAKKKLYSHIETLPDHKVGLVLGASKYTSNGLINLYYTSRLEAAIALYEAGKVKYLLISGDHGRLDYNEPEDFKIDLVKAGIPEERIFLDYAGFRTLDSMVRAKAVFGIDEGIVISQKFHNERAVFISEKKGMNFIAYNARDIKGSAALKTNIREYLARVKAVLDIQFNKQPKYLGVPICIE